MHKLWTARQWKLPGHHESHEGSSPQGSQHVQFELQQPALPALKRVSTAPTISRNVHNSVRDTQIPKGPFHMIKHSLEEIREERRAKANIENGSRAKLSEQSINPSLPNLQGEKLPLAYLAQHLETFASGAESHTALAAKPT